MAPLRKSILAAASALLVLAIAVIWFFTAPGDDRASEGPELAGDRAPAPQAETTAPAPGLLAPGLPDDPEAVLGRALARFAGVTDRAASRRLVDELEAYLFALPEPEASAAMVEFLDDPSRDARTYLGFSVGAGGRLEDPSTLRVALLDWLGVIDPGAAASVSESILAGYTDPDEWAVSMRNYAWATPLQEARDFLAGRAAALLANPDWRASPTAGFLEAFDVFVYTGAVESTPALAGALADDSEAGRATAYAAFMTIDRLVLERPVDMLERVRSEPALQARREAVAQWMARADFREPEQRAAVARYLLDPARSEAELAAFAGTFPNANFMVSENLLTELRVPSGAELAARNRAALEQVEEWLGQDRFAGCRDSLEQIRRRLVTLVGEG